MSKKNILAALKELPEDASYIDAIKRLDKLHNIERGLGPDEWFASEELDAWHRKRRAERIRRRNQWVHRLSDEGIEAEWKHAAQQRPEASIAEIKEHVQRDRLRSAARQQAAPGITIQLWQATGLGLVLPAPSGAIYSSQTGGTSCHHPEAEGLYVPLTNDLVDQQQQLHAYFTGPKWRGACSDGIDLETAQAVDQILQQSEETRMLSVDRDCLYLSEEAWVYVHIGSIQRSVGVPYLTGKQLSWGILTWANSD